MAGRGPAAGRIFRGRVDGDAARSLAGGVDGGSRPRRGAPRGYSEGGSRRREKTARRYSQLGVDASWSLDWDSRDWAWPTDILGPAPATEAEMDAYRSMYWNLSTTFNPTEFNSTEWADVAVRAGFTYDCRVEILLVGPGFALYFKRTAPAVRRCKSQQERCSYGRETGPQVLHHDDKTPRRLRHVRSPCGSSEDGSRRRRGRDVAIPWERVAAAPRPQWIFRGDRRTP